MSYQTIHSNHIILILLEIYKCIKVHIILLGIYKCILSAATILYCSEFSFSVYAGITSDYFWVATDSKFAVALPSMQKLHLKRSPNYLMPEHFCNWNLSFSLSTKNTKTNS